MEGNIMIKAWIETFETVDDSYCVGDTLTLANGLTGTVIDFDDDCMYVREQHSRMVLRYTLRTA